MTLHHNQTPTNTLTEADYETIIVHLAEQIAGRAEFHGRDETHKSAIDALANTYGTSEDQTILDWLLAAGRRVGIDASACEGV